jgi:sulfur transfer complex TusBCD TusB component (DsrH family)
MVAGGALHIIRKRGDAFAAAVIAEQRRKGPVGVVLVQDGILADVSPSVDVYVNGEDAVARGVETPYRRVGYEEIARFVADASSVMVW